VVASEVRSLAQRSAGAAKEIKGLIDDSVGKVADGSALVAKAGSTMAEIVTSVQRVTDIMAEISAASQEQRPASSRSTRPSPRWTRPPSRTPRWSRKPPPPRSLEGAGRDGLMSAVSVFRIDGAAGGRWSPFQCRLDFAALGEGAKSPAVAFRAAKPAARAARLR
jgi:hypothetical protein